MLACMVVDSIHTEYPQDHSLIAVGVVECYPEALQRHSQMDVVNSLHGLWLTFCETI